MYNSAPEGLEDILGPGESVGFWEEVSFRKQRFQWMRHDPDLGMRRNRHAMMTRFTENLPDCSVCGGSTYVGKVIIEFCPACKARQRLFRGERK